MREKKAKGKMIGKEKLIFLLMPRSSRRQYLLLSLRGVPVRVCTLGRAAASRGRNSSIMCLGAVSDGRHKNMLRSKKKGGEKTIAVQLFPPSFLFVSCFALKLDCRKKEHTSEILRSERRKMDHGTQDIMNGSLEAFKEVLTSLFFFSSLRWWRRGWKGTS